MVILYFIGIVVVIGIVAIVYGSIKERIELAEDEAHLKRIYDARKTYGPYSVGDFYSNGEFREGMVVSLQNDGTVVRCVSLDSGWDNDIENLPPLNDPVLPTVEELETIAELSDRFLKLRKDYFPRETESIFCKKDGYPKLYASSSIPTNVHHDGRIFYDLGRKKRVVATINSTKDGYETNDDKYSYLSYEFYRLAMFTDRIGVQEDEPQNTVRKVGKKKKGNGCVITIVILVVFLIVAQIILSEL